MDVHGFNCTINMVLAPMQFTLGGYVGSGLSEDKPAIETSILKEHMSYNYDI